MTVENIPSPGSVENIRRVNKGGAAFGIAYSGDTYLARNGLLSNDSTRYSNVMAVAYLYGAPAQLITRSDIGIESVRDLAGKRVAVGAAGSGAAASAQRYFTALGLWEKMKVVFIGYSKAAEALVDKDIDAFWILTGFPNPAARKAADSAGIKILDTWQAGEEAGLFKHFPFNTPVTIPAGTYRGIDQEVNTFQDSALWIAGKQADQKIVYQALSDIFTPESLDYLVTVQSAARSMTLDHALTGIVTPVHFGAIRFWTEHRAHLEPSHLAD